MTGAVAVAGWYRIAKYTTSWSYPVNFLVNLGHIYASGGPCNLWASVTITGYAYKITILDSSYYRNICIDNLRLMQLDDNNIALDIHYSMTGSNGIYSRFICGTAKLEYITLQAPTLVQDSPSGETLLALADWLNPPMQLGVEYRTAERYGGKPVYAKLIDLGAAVNGAVIEAVDSTKQIIRISLGKGNSTIFPVGGYDTNPVLGPYDVVLASDGRNIKIFAGSKAASDSGNQISVEVFYIDA